MRRFTDEYIGGRPVWKVVTQTCTEDPVGWPPSPHCSCDDHDALFGDKFKGRHNIYSRIYCDQNRPSRNRRQVILGVHRWDFLLWGHVKAHVYYEYRPHEPSENLKTEFVTSSI
ncbi:hypothetical protein QTP88_021497 [Uroleucon formosanum]